MSDSVTRWLSRLKDGDHSAAQKLWERYFQRLVGVARSKVRRDEEDLALDVFAALCRIAQRGRLRSKNRDELWRLLMRITVAKSIDRYRSDERTVMASNGLWDDECLNEEGPQPTPETMVMLNDELQNLLSRLPDDVFRRIVRMKLERYTNREIAQELGVVERTVERKLRIIRDEWVDAS